MKNKRLIQYSLALIFILNTVVGIYGQSTKQNADLTTPFNTIYNHLFYLQPEQYRPALSSQSFSLAKDSLASINNAIHLKQILDARGLYVYMSTIPDKVNFIDSLSGKSIFTPFPNKLPDVYLQKIEDKWLYSEETNHQIPLLLRKTFPFGSHRLVQYFSNKQQSSFLGLAIWQYIALLILLFLAFILYKLLSGIIHFAYRKMLGTRFQKIIAFDSDHKLSNPLSIIFVLYIVRLFLPILQLNVRWTEYIIVGLNIAIAIIVGLLIFRLIDVLIYHFSKIADKTESKLDEQLIPIIHRLLKILVFIITFMYVLNLLHVNITALIAGVSIGGLALALAAQDTVKNFIGSVMIFLDAPFQIGDYIIVNGMEGTVVEVGFRSTKIQTIDSSIITIPNGSLSSTSLTNKGVRTHRLFDSVITLSYNTKQDKIKAFISGLKNIIEQDSKIENEGYYVHLKELNSSSIDIMFRAKLITTAYDTELMIKENILFSIIELAEELGVDFAFPSQSIYIEK